MLPVIDPPGCIVTSQGEGSQAVAMKLSPNALQQAMQGGPLSVCFDTNTFYVGNTAFKFMIAEEKTVQEVYQYTRAGKSRSLQLAGLITQRATLEHDWSDVNAQKVKSRTEEAERERHSRKVVEVECSSLPRQKRRANAKGKEKLSLPTMRSAPSSPFLGAGSPQPTNGSSPRLAPSKPSGSPLQTRIIQLLALGCATEAELIKRTRGPANDISAILRDVAKRDGIGWKLQDRSFGLVKVWDWQYTTPERNAVIEAATAAFDRLGLPRDAPERVVLEKGQNRRSGTSPQKPSTPEVLSREPSREPKVGGGLIRKGVKRKEELTPSNRSKRTKAESVAASSDEDIGLGIATKRTASSNGGSPLKASPQSMTYPPAEDMATSKPDLLVLAKRFRERHTEYAKLYKELVAIGDDINDRNYKPKYDRLMKMHNELGQWKSTLYAASKRQDDKWADVPKVIGVK